MQILEYLGKITTGTHRMENARNLARLLRAEDFFIFTLDHELNILLPAPGFPQTFPNYGSWKIFFASDDKTIFKGEVPYPDKETHSLATAVRGNDGSIAVLLGGNPQEEDIKILQVILPILSPSLKQEQIVISANSKADHYSKIAEKAERLTSTLDKIRNDLMNKIAENSKLFNLTKTQNDDLVAANEELSAANEEVLAGLEELNEKNKQLSSVNAEMDNFIYTASHDLKAPILNIEGLIIMLSRNMKANGWADTHSNKIFEMIYISINRFKNTIMDLTEVIKIGRETLERSESVNLVEVIEHVMQDLEFMIIESEAKINIEVDPSVYLAISKKNLKSVIYNLLSNAVKYKSEESPIIHVLSKEVDEYVLLSVKDNGLGMDTSDLNKIFGLFKRLHNHVEGTGIGLYIVKKIIDESAGRIEINSERGKGTTFNVYFKKGQLE